MWSTSRARWCSCAPQHSQRPWARVSTRYLIEPLIALLAEGIEAQAAEQLWNDSELLEVPARTTGEPRFLVIGRIGVKHWSAVITYRDQSIRLISVRRSRPEEVEIYEQF
jgi:uncharacterized protein